jgi:hypothetical protein
LEKFTRSGVEIKDASIAFHLSETRPTACFFYKGLDDVDPYLDGLNSFLNGNEPDHPLEPSPSIYRNHDQIFQLFDYQRIFLHYAREQGSPFTFIAAEAAGFDGPCLIRLSRGIDGMSPFVPPGEPRDLRVSADGADAEVRWTAPDVGAECVRQFDVLFRDQGDPQGCWKCASAEATVARIPGLVPGHKYFFKVGFN